MSKTRLTSLLLAVMLMASSTACARLDWLSGKTHGPIIEPAALRASIGIYRVPRNVIHEVYKKHGIRRAADVIWGAGKPPVSKLKVGDVTMSTDLIRRKFHGYVYGDLDDLRGALRDAQAHDDCLALTLISRGLYIKNWTHKSHGCKDGRL